MSDLAIDADMSKINNYSVVHALNQAANTARVAWDIQHSQDPAAYLILSSGSRGFTSTIDIGKPALDRMNSLS